MVVQHIQKSLIKKQEIPKKLWVCHKNQTKKLKNFITLFNPLRSSIDESKNGKKQKLSKLFNIWEK